MRTIVPALTLLLAGTTASIYLSPPVTSGLEGGIPSQEADEPLHYRCTRQGEDGINLVLMPRRGIARTTHDAAPQFGTSTWLLTSEATRYVLSTGPVWLALDRTSGWLASSMATANSPAIPTTCVRLAGD